MCALSETRADYATRRGPSHLKEPIADSARKMNSDPWRYIHAQIVPFGHTGTSQDIRRGLIIYSFGLRTGAVCKTLPVASEGCP